jgi:hypothetical protein
MSPVTSIATVAVAADDVCMKTAIDFAGTLALTDAPEQR